METLIWLFGSTIGAGIWPALSCLLKSSDQRRTARIAIASSIISAMLVLLIGPSCMCTNVRDMLLGSTMFGVLLGAAVSILLTLGVRLWAREREELPR
jgi:uncharacterized membrane protein